MLSPRAAFGQGEGDRLAVREREGRRCELRLRPVLVGKLVIRENGHAQGFHLGEERRRAARAVEHEGEPVEQGGGRQLRGGGLGGGIGDEAGHDRVAQNLNEAVIDGAADEEKRPAVDRVDPIIGHPAQAQFLARDITAGPSREHH